MITVVIIAVPVGIVLWITWTHDLHYNVYTDEDVVLYQEYFPTYFNLIVTLLLSILFGLIVAAVIWIGRYLRQSSSR